MAGHPETLVPPAEIARLTGVTRAAVSNWRRRYADFPQPVGGTGVAPLFALAEVREWLERSGKGRSVSGEVRLWQALRAGWGDDLLGALGAVAATLQGEVTELGLSDEAAGLVKELANERTGGELVAALVERFVGSNARGGGEPVSTARLVQVVRWFAGETEGTVYDPACGVGELLLSVGGGGVRGRVGQDVDGRVVEFVRRRSVLEGRPGSVDVACGDSLCDDGFPGLRAELVVCEPPSGPGDWGRDGLMLDPRWEFGLPPKSEGELAWLQHCYAHTAPGGRAVVVLPASAAYRRPGRRIRAEMVRRGVVDTVVALPGGFAAGHGAPVHLWVLARPAGVSSSDARVRMVDLSEMDGAVEPPPSQVVSVPVITLLDDDVDLTPSHHVAAARPEQAKAYDEVRSRFEELLGELSGRLPRLGDGGELSAHVSVSELVRSGLVRVEDGRVSSTSDALDEDFLLGFLQSAANTRRNTSASGTYRADPRGVRLPQMDVERQRGYGTAFRELESFVRRLEEVAKIGQRAVRLARDGLTSGTLRPDGVAESVEREGDE